LVALEGKTVALRVSKPPTLMLADVLLRDTLVTCIAVPLTLTAQVAVLFPSAVVTVITTLPVDTPITTPFATVATAVLLLLHDTF
jgi:hypothetical protein